VPISVLTLLVQSTLSCAACNLARLSPTSSRFVLLPTPPLSLSLAYRYRYRGNTPLFARSVAAVSCSRQVAHSVCLFESLAAQWIRSMTSRQLVEMSTARAGSLAGRWRDVSRTSSGRLRGVGGDVSGARAACGRGVVGLRAGRSGVAVGAWSERCWRVGGSRWCVVGALTALVSVVGWAWSGCGRDVVGALTVRGRGCRRRHTAGR